MWLALGGDASLIVGVIMVRVVTFLLVKCISLHGIKTQRYHATG